MKKLITLLLAALIAIPALAATVKKGGNYALTGDNGVSGKMSFTAKILDGNKKFKIIFKNAKGDWLMFWYFDPASNKVFCYYPNHKCNHQLPGKLELNKEIKIDISIANDRYAVLSVDGQELACMALPAGELHKVYLFAEGGSMSVDAMQWQADAATAMRFFVGTPGRMHNAPLAKVPTGDFEISFDFTAQKVNDGNGHFGIELHSGQKSDGKIQLVFRERGVQIIRGPGNAKWLGNFPADFFGKKHTFTIRLIDSDLYEFLIDGQRINTFETEIEPGGDIVIWSYRNWNFEISNFTINPLAEEEL